MLLTEIWLSASAGYGKSTGGTGYTGWQEVMYIAAWCWWGQSKINGYKWRWSGHVGFIKGCYLKWCQFIKTNVCALMYKCKRLHGFPSVMSAKCMSIQLLFLNRSISLSWINSCVRDWETIGKYVYHLLLVKSTCVDSWNNMLTCWYISVVPLNPRLEVGSMQLKIWRNWWEQGTKMRSWMRSCHLYCRYKQHGYIYFKDGLVVC